MKALLMFRGGVRTISKTLSDGKEHTLYYKARTPNELAGFLGADKVLGEKPDSAVALQKLRAKFIADALCNEDGSQLMTVDEAEKVTIELKLDLCAAISSGSNEAGDAGKG